MSFGKKYADVANVANAVQQALTGKEKEKKVRRIRLTIRQCTHQMLI